MNFRFSPSTSSAPCAVSFGSTDRARFSSDTLTDSSLASSRTEAGDVLRRCVDADVRPGDVCLTIASVCSASVQSSLQEHATDTGAGAEPGIQANVPARRNRFSHGSVVGERRTNKCPEIEVNNVICRRTNDS
jgi:hypothetical protein